MTISSVQAAVLAAAAQLEAENRAKAAKQNKLTQLREKLEDLAKAAPAQGLRCELCSNELLPDDDCVLTYLSCCSKPLLLCGAESCARHSEAEFELAVSVGKNGMIIARQS